MSTGPGDPPTLAIEPVSLGRAFAKHSFIKRRFQEVEVGKRIAARLDAFAPQVVVGSNLPLDSLRIVARSCRRRHCGFVFWQQDIYSVAIERILSEKFGLAGRLFGKYYKSIEAGVLRASQATVVISQDFIQACARSSVLPAAISMSWKTGRRWTR